MNIQLANRTERQPIEAKLRRMHEKGWIDCTEMPRIYKFDSGAYVVAVPADPEGGIIRPVYDRPQTSHIIDKDDYDSLAALGIVLAFYDGTLYGVTGKHRRAKAAEEPTNILAFIVFGATQSRCARLYTLEATTKKQSSTDKWRAGFYDTEDTLVSGVKAAFKDAGVEIDAEWPMREFGKPEPFMRALAPPDARDMYGTGGPITHERLVDVARAVIYLSENAPKWGKPVMYRALMWRATAQKGGALAASKRLVRSDFPWVPGLLRASWPEGEWLGKILAKPPADIFEALAVRKSAQS